MGLCTRVRSGATPDCPSLLKYACALLTNVRPVAPATITLPALPSTSAGTAGGARTKQRQQQQREEEEAGLVWAVLGGRPLVALAFDDMMVSGTHRGGPPAPRVASGRVVV